MYLELNHIFVQKIPTIINWLSHFIPTGLNFPALTRLCFLSIVLILQLYSHNIFGAKNWKPIGFFLNIWMNQCYETSHRNKFISHFMLKHGMAIYYFKNCSSSTYTPQLESSYIMFDNSFIFSWDITCLFWCVIIMMT